MTAKVLAFFNNKGGLGKTSLAYHLAWVYSDLGVCVLAADLDPQANLSAAFTDDESLEEFWREDAHPRTVYGCVRPLQERHGLSFKSGPCGSRNSRPFSF